MKINKQYDWIIAITRGGLVPSALLSHILDIKKIDTINIWSYDEKTPKEVSFINKDFSNINNKKVLLVDDLVETGKTFNFAIDHLKKFNPSFIDTFVIYKKKESNFIPTYYIKEVGGEWIDFNYEEISSVEDIEEYIKK